MKILLTCLLSAVIFQHAQATPAHINNVDNRAKVQAVQAKTQVEKALTEPQIVSTPEINVAVAEVKPEVTPQPTDHEQLMSLAGINPEDYGAVDFIITHESSWRYFATEPNTGAYGLCQSLPATKMASAGSDWQDNPVTQLKWCSQYAADRYGSWQGAYSFWLANRWW